MLQAANNDLFNPLVPKAHNTDFGGFLFIGTNGLSQILGIDYDDLPVMVVNASWQSDCNTVYVSLYSFPIMTMM